MTTKQYLLLQDIYAENCDASGNQTNLYPALGLGVRGNYQVSLMNASALDTTGVDSWLFAIGQDFDAGTTILYENPNVTYAVNGTSGTFTVTEVSGLDTSEMKDWIGAEETPTVVGELIGMGADHNKNKPVSLVQWRMFIRNRVDYEGQEMDVVPSYATSGMLAEALGGVPTFATSATLTGDNPLWTETKRHPGGYPVYTVYKVATPFTLNIDDDSVAATGFLQGLYMYQDPVEGQLVGQMTRNLSLAIADSGNGVWTGSDEVTYQWEDGEYEFPETPVPTTVSISVAINKTEETVDEMTPGEVRLTVGGNTATGNIYSVSPKTFIAKAGGDFTGEIGVHRLKSGSVSIPVKPYPSGTSYFEFNDGYGYPRISFEFNPSLSPNGKDSIEFQNATTVRWQVRRGTRLQTVMKRFTYPLVYDGSKYYGEHYFTTHATGTQVLIGAPETYLSQSTLSRKNDAWMLEVSLSSDEVGAYNNVYRSEIDTSQIMDLIPYATTSGGVFEYGIRDGRNAEEPYYITNHLGWETVQNNATLIFPGVVGGNRYGFKVPSSIEVSMDDYEAVLASGIGLISGDLAQYTTYEDVVLHKTNDGDYTATATNVVVSAVYSLEIDDDNATLTVKGYTPNQGGTVAICSGVPVEAEHGYKYATSSDIAPALTEQYTSLTTDTGTLTIYDNPWDNPNSLSAHCVFGNTGFVYDGTLPKYQTGEYSLEGVDLGDGYMITVINVNLLTDPPHYWCILSHNNDQIFLDNENWDIPQSWERSKFIPVSGGKFAGPISAYDGNQYATSGQYEEMIQSRIDNPEYAGDNYLPTITASADAFNPCGPLGNHSVIANRLFQAYQQYDRPAYGHPGYVTRDLKWTTKSPSMNWDGGTLYDQFAEWTWLHKPVTVADGTDHNYYITSRYVGMNGAKARFEMDCWKTE